MDLSAIIDEFNRRRMRDKAQAGQGIADTLGLQKKPADWFQQMQQGQNAVVTPEQRTNVNKELADMLERFTAGVVPEPIRARERAMRTDPSAAAKPFTSEEVKGITPFVTAAAPIAYHGTPHTFDKFDASKIGTGQGAQSYGHGLYFAENPATAKTYYDQLGGSHQEMQNLKVGSKSVGPHNNFDYSPRGNSIKENIHSSLIEDLMLSEEGLKKASIDPKELQSFVLKKLDERISTMDWPEAMPEALKLKAELSKPGAIALKLSKPQGAMYQVNIPDQHAARMLDWDKPLSEQAPEVQKALADLRFPDVATGNQIWDAIKNRAMSRLDPSERKGLETYGPAASAELNRRGIPGIKYLDQGSRREVQMKLAQDFKSHDYFVKDIPGKMFKSRQEAQAAIDKMGTRNFVVFDPAILEDVTKK